MTNEIAVLTIRTAALLFPGLTETAIRRLVRSGEIPSRRIGAKYLLTPAAIQAWLDGAGQIEQPPTPNGVRVVREG